MKHQRLYKTVADKLLKVIESGAYKVGDRLPAERDLAIEYNVSRPTMREAVIALEIAGRVEVRKGSGVYVLHQTQDNKNGGASTILDMNVGAFELTEARMLIEGEVAALAARMITEEEIETLSDIIERMRVENERDSGDESADKLFHLTIAQAAGNASLVTIVECLWNLREKSPLTQNMYETVRLEGVKPNIEEHLEILDALKAKDPAAARTAMRTHLSRVIETLFKATEIHAVELAKQKVLENRERYSRALASD